MPAKLSKAFWKWFGDSVVRNEDGSPMVVYHGTPAMPYNIRYVEYLCEAVRIAFKHVGEPYPGDDEIVRRMTSWHNTIVEFSCKNPEVIPEDILTQLAQYIPFSTFERGHHYRPDQDARIGFYFTPNERFARHFMSVVEYDPILGTKREVYVGHPHLYAVYLRIEHPLDLTLATKSNAEFLKTTGHLNVETADEVRSYLRSAGGSKMLQQSFARLGVEKLKSLGFDGIINKVKFLGRQEIELSVFDPDQIKSIDNDGTWDAGDPNIRSNPPVHAIRSIERRHAVTDPYHARALAGSIRTHGWRGPPLVIWGPINWGNSRMLTGVHRMAALDLLMKQDREFAEGLDIPVLVVDQRGLSEEVIDDTGIHWDGDIGSLYDSDEIATLLDAMGEREAASLVRDEGGDVLGADDPRVGSNPRKASAPNETYTLRHVVDHLKKTDGTGDPEWMRHLIKEVSPYPVWELHSLDPREVENHCSDKETAEEYAEVINELPPAVAIPSSDTGRLELVDGGHRFYAAALVGTAFPCYIPAGMRGLK